KYSLFALIGISCCWISCNENQQSSSQGEAIVLGDSSTIVTETDSAYLQEVVADFKEPVPETGLEPEAPAPKADTAKTIQEITKATLPEIKGFLLDSGTASAVFANIETREFRKQNPATSDGLSYAITSGKLSQLQVSGVKELKVRQRYQSALLIKGRKGTLELPGYYTSTWETLNGKQSGDQF